MWPCYITNKNKRELSEWHETSLNLVLSYYIIEHACKVKSTETSRKQNMIHHQDTSKMLKIWTAVKRRIAKWRSYPNRRLGSLTFIRLRIWLERVSTKASLPSLLWGAPVNIDFKLSLSARHEISNELWDPGFAEANETDWPIRATHGISTVLGGPWPTISAWVAATTLGSDDSWSILLMTPTVLVATVPKNHLYNLCSLIKVRIKLKQSFKPTSAIIFLCNSEGFSFGNFLCLSSWYYNQQYCIIVLGIFPLQEQ